MMQPPAPNSFYRSVGERLATIPQSLSTLESTLPPQTKLPSRIGHKKHRTGCITCKARKVKCDEAKPSCQRCLKARRVCEGYSIVRLRDVVRVKAPAAIPMFRTAAEIRAFEFYKYQSGALLGGITSRGEEFWEGIVLQLTDAEPAVKHAVLALSILHEDVCFSKHRSATRVELAFSQYGKAIAAVRSWDTTDIVSSRTTSIPLLVCVLFVCIEFLMGHETAAQLHICQGRLMLSETNEALSTTGSTKMIKTVLVPIYARLGLACFLFTSQPEPIPARLTVGVAQTPQTISSATEARDTLFRLIDEGLRFTVSSKKAAYNPAAQPNELQTLETIQARFLAQLSNWDAAFTCLQTSSTSKTPVSRAIHDLLYVFYNAALIWVSTALSSRESAYDDHMSSFAAIIRHAYSAIVVPGSMQSRDAVFTFETECLAPIYWTAIKCRHPRLRRAALKLLEREEVKRRRENLWQAYELATVAKFVIQAEERNIPPTCYDNSDGQTCHLEGTQVPSTQPPTMPEMLAKFGQAKLWELVQEPFYYMPVSDVLSEHTSDTEDIGESGMTPIAQSDMLQPPFGVPETERVKNTSIGPRDLYGMWVTTFTDPQPGTTHWTVKKRYLKGRKVV